MPLPAPAVFEAIVPLATEGGAESQIPPPSVLVSAPPPAPPEPGFGAGRTAERGAARPDVFPLIVVPVSEPPSLATPPPARAAPPGADAARVGGAVLPAWPAPPAPA